MWVLFAVGWAFASPAVAWVIGKGIKLADLRSPAPDYWLANPDAATWTADVIDLRPARTTPGSNEGADQ